MLTVDQLKDIRMNRPWVFLDYAAAISLPGAIMSSVVDHIVRTLPELEGYSNVEHQLYAFTQKQVMTSMTYGEAASTKIRRAEAAMKRGEDTEFGQMLKDSPARHMAYVLSLIADHAKLIGVNKP